MRRGFILILVPDKDWSMVFHGSVRSVLVAVLEGCMFQKKKIHRELRDQGFGKV